jgi:hypothetical protein
MAILSDPDRAGVVTAWMRANTSPMGALTKAELRLALNAIDQWAESNAASLNAAIPQPARGVLTAKQKAWLLLFVINRRFEVV